VYSYALRVWEAFGGSAKFLHLRMRPAPILPHAPDGHSDLVGSHPQIPALDVVLNSVIPFSNLQGYRSALVDAEMRGAAVHYSSLDVPPLPPSTRSVVTIHDDPRAILSRTLYSARLRYRAILWFRTQLYRRFRHIITTSKHVKDRLLDYGVEGSVDVIHPCVPPNFVPMPREPLRKELGLPEGKVLILSVSSAEGRKNLAAVRDLILRLDSNMMVVRVGPAIPGALNLGRLSSEAMPRLFNSCDLLIHPALEEGFGFPVAEAFAVGLPVVASDIEVMREVSGGAAMLIDPHSVDDILRGVRTVLRERQSYCERSLTRGGEFGCRRFYSQISGYFARLCDA
jgi:glycosyltransferase involved in cell wall biosynthesis